MGLDAVVMRRSLPVVRIPIERRTRRRRVAFGQRPHLQEIADADVETI
jgi:hypothetical protein